MYGIFQIPTFFGGSWRVQVLLCLSAAIAMSLTGLWCIWGGLGRQHWFLRMAAVLGWIWLCAAIPVHELIVVFLLQAGVTIIEFSVWRTWRSARRSPTAEAGSTADSPPPNRWQFSIRDLLLLTAVVAAVSAMLTSVPGDVWTRWRELLQEGVGAALLTLAAVWIALGRNWRWGRLLAFVVLLPSALMVVWLVLFRWARFGRTVTAETRTPWIEWTSRMALALLSLLMVLPAVAVCWRVAHPLPIPVTTLPSPNGYDDLVEAGRIVGKVHVPDAETATRAELETFVAQYGRVHDLARAAMRKPCQVPVALKEADLTPWLDRIQGMRQLAWALCAKARLAQLEGRTADAVAAYVDTIRLGQSVEQGGLPGDMLVGNAIKTIGRNGIRDLRRELSARQCLELIRTLNDLMDREEPLNEYFARDAIWDDNAHGVQGRFLTMLSTVAGETAAFQGVLVKSCNWNLTKSRLLVCDLAIRAYSLAHGRPPATLAVLVPDYLPEVPEDPFSGGTIVYRLTPDGYLLYSVGVDGVDDGGRQGDRSDLEQGCDIRLDDPPPVFR